MKLLWIWPWWLVVIVLVAGLTLCWLGWRESGSRREANLNAGRSGNLDAGRGAGRRLGGRDAGRKLGGPDLRWLRRGLMVAVVALMGAAPGVRTDVAEVGTNAEVYFVVDATGSMGAEDYGTGGAGSADSDGVGGEEATDPAAGQRRVDGVRADMIALAR